MSATTDPPRVTVASLGEVTGGAGIMSTTLMSRLPGQTVIGPATTCVTPAGHNAAVHLALAAAKPGDVIVVTAIGDGATGLWGGLATRSAKARGIAGVVADGAVRDTRDFRELGFPVWSTTVSPRGAAKQAVGAVNVPVVCGGVVVHPRDIVVADDDGVAVVPAADAKRLLEATRDREAGEAALYARLERGESTIDVLNLDLGT